MSDRSRSAKRSRQPRSSANSPRSALLSKPAVSRALDRLGELGYIRRQRDDLEDDADVISGDIEVEIRRVFDEPAYANALRARGVARFAYADRNAPARATLGLLRELAAKNPASSRAGT